MSPAPTLRYLVYVCSHCLLFDPKLYLLVSAGRRLPASIKSPFILRPFKNLAAPLTSKSFN